VSFFSTSDSTDSSKRDGQRATTLTTQSAAPPAAVPDIVYESPLGNLVRRLRTVSLATGICGTLGLPLVVAIKGGDLPSTGLLAFGVAFLTGSLGSTAAIHFVFSPYVFTIERIPVRMCHFNKGKVGGLEGAGESAASESGAATDENDETIQQDQALSTSPSPSAPKDYLYKATSRSLFLYRIETVFNPETDVTEYKGFKPLCNFVAKGRSLYVHPEYVYNAQLRHAMKLNSDLRKGGMTAKENPDDFL
jgi:hypothetical protein